MIEKRRLWGGALSALALVFIAMSWHSTTNLSALALLIVGLLVALMPERAWKRYQTAKLRNEVRQQNFFTKYPSAKSRETWAKRLAFVACALGMIWTYVALTLFSEIGATWILAGTFLPIGLVVLFMFFNDMRKVMAMRKERNDG